MSERSTKPAGHDFARDLRAVQTDRRFCLGDTGDLETMRTACPSCDTTYTIPDERIGAKGRKVRCTRCGEEWRVMPGAEEPPPPIRAAPPPPPPPPAPRRSETVDPFDALDDHAVGDDALDAFAGAAAPDAADDPTRDDATTATDEPRPASAPPAAAGPSVAARLAGHIRIRTKRRLPRLHGEILGRVTASLAPFVGPMVFLAACLVLPGIYVFRQPIVAAAPDLAGLYSALGAPVNLRGLAFGRIETLREIDNGQTVLVIEGSIANVSKQMREVPALRFSLRGADTQEVYAWSIDPKSTTIESGDTIRFRTRLAAPPDQATDVQVRFVERRSQHAGLP